MDYIHSKQDLSFVVLRMFAVIFDQLEVEDEFLHKD